MKLSLSLFVLAATLVVLGQAVEYPSRLGYYEGSYLYVWEFGAASSNNPSPGNVWTPAVIVPGTITSGPDGTSYELQFLKCGDTKCPDVFETDSGSLWIQRLTILDDWLPSHNNASYNTMSMLNPDHNETGTQQYRRKVNSGDSLENGVGTPTLGAYNGANRYYFSFGNDLWGAATGKLYNFVGGHVVLSTVSTHYLQKYNINPPAGADISGIIRVSDIPADWLSNSTITTTDGNLYEFGFFANAATPVPATAAALLPSLFLILAIAILSVFVF